VSRETFRLSAPARARSLTSRRFEVGVKLTALGARPYFASPWNVLDVAVTSFFVAALA
jgi:hypothetical protein